MPAPPRLTRSLASTTLPAIARGVAPAALRLPAKATKVKTTRMKIAKRTTIEDCTTAGTTTMIGVVGTTIGVVGTTTGMVGTTTKTGKDGSATIVIGRRRTT